MFRFSLGERTRKWLREVGSIVLGVLIALGLGAIASEIGWWWEVRGAREAMSGELGELIGQAEERVNIDGCIERRLDELASIVRDAEIAGKLPPIGQISTPPYRSWPVGVWQSTLAAQSAAHLDRELLDNYSTAYDFVARLSAMHDREFDAWTRLHMLVGPGRALTAEEARELRQALSQARFANRFVTLNGLRMKQVTIAYRLGYDAEEAAAYNKRPQDSFEICRPMGSDIPGAYGAAPFAGTVKRAIDNPITREGLGLDSPKR